MSAVLKIYDSVEAQEPSKVFTCHRLTMGLDNKLNELTEEISLIQKEIETKVKGNEKASLEDQKKIREEIKPLEAEASRLTFETIKLFFPSFTEEDFLNLDPYDYQTFVFEISEMRNKIYNRAAKN